MSLYIVFVLSFKHFILFYFIQLIVFIWLLIALYIKNSGTKKVVFHGSLNKLTFKIKKKRVVNKTKSKYEIFPFQRFCNRITYLMSLFCCILEVNMMLFG
jgi:hypothetical protein